MRLNPSPETIVAEVARDPSALEVLKRMGINHCCGAHLSLREAAAAAVDRAARVGRLARVVLAGRRAAARVPLS